MCEEKGTYTYTYEKYSFSLPCKCFMILLVIIKLVCGLYNTRYDGDDLHVKPFVPVILVKDWIECREVVYVFSVNMMCLKHHVMILLWETADIVDRTDWRRGDKYVVIGFVDDKNGDKTVRESKNFFFVLTEWDWWIR